MHVDSLILIWKKKYRFATESTIYDSNTIAPRQRTSALGRSFRGKSSYRSLIMGSERAEDDRWITSDTHVDRG